MFCDIKRILTLEWWRLAETPKKVGIFFWRKNDNQLQSKFWYYIFLSVHCKQYLSQLTATYRSTLKTSLCKTLLNLQFDCSLVALFYTAVVDPFAICSNICILVSCFGRSSSNQYQTKTNAFL